MQDHQHRFPLTPQISLFQSQINRKIQKNQEFPYFKRIKKGLPSQVALNKYHNIKTDLLQ